MQMEMAPEGANPLNQFQITYKDSNESFLSQGIFEFLCVMEAEEQATLTVETVLGLCIAEVTHCDPPS